MTDAALTPVSFPEVEAARATIRESVVNTPCPRSYLLSQLLGCDVSCKLDYLQHTGSFKERGVANALANLSETDRRRGVIAASAGNHALALAYHGKRLGVPVTVVMPVHAPLIKTKTCREFGAEVVIHGDCFTDTRDEAMRLADARSLTYIHGFNNRHVIAGQGTLGLEVLEQAPDLDAIIVPIGGAGLIAGVATAIKSKRRDVEIIGVEPARTPSFTRSLEAGAPTAVPLTPTLADGLAVGCVGDLAFVTAAPLVDRVVTVEESHLSLAILRLLELEKAVVEGAGAAPLAAMLTGQLAHLKGKRVVLPLCGGNIDPLALRRVIDFGLSTDGRLCRLSAIISDRPGGLAKLTSLLAEAGASIQDIRHERVFVGPDVSNVRVQVVIETRNREHHAAVRELLRTHGIDVADEQGATEP